METLYKFFKGTDVQRSFAIASLCVATLEFLGGLPSK